MNLQTYKNVEKMQLGDRSRLQISIPYKNATVLLRYINTFQKKNVSNNAISFRQKLIDIPPFKTK